MNEVDARMIAARQAHHPLTNEFLLDAPQSTSRTAKKRQAVRGGHWRDAHFHAAVGLAEFCVPEGVKSLIAHTAPAAGENHFFRAPHVKNDREHEACRFVLFDPTGHQPVSAEISYQRPQWQSWWAANKVGFAPIGSAALRVP